MDSDSAAVPGPSDNLVPAQEDLVTEKVTDSDNVNLDCVDGRVPMLAGMQKRRRLSFTHCIRNGLFNVLLRRAFFFYGLFVGKYAPVIIFVVTLVSLNAIGLYRLKLEDRVRDGFTPIGSPSFREYEIYKDFMGTTGDPMFTVAIIRAKDNGSMVRLEQLQSTVDFAGFLMNNFTVQPENYDKEIRFSDMCDSYCDFNVMLKFFLKSFQEQHDHLAKGEPLNPKIDLDYPIATVALPMPVNMSMFRVFRQVHKYDLNDTTERPSKIKHVGLIMLVFRSDKTEERIVNGVDLLAEWERAAYEYVQHEYTDKYIRVDIVGSEILNSEIIRGGRQTLPFFAVGFLIMTVFVLTAVTGSALYYDQMDPGKFLVAGATLLAPMFACASTMGFTSLLGLRTNSMTLVVPFLVMAIGVDDAFLMIHAWQRFTANKAKRLESASERLGWVLEEVGPSITITSLTNCVAFGIGAFTPTPEIRLFARTAAIAMAMDYFFEITFFAGCLALSARWEKQIVRDTKNKYDKIREKIQSASSSFLREYSKLLVHPVTAVVTLCLVIVYWVIIVIGAVRIQPKLDGQKLLPQDSPLREVDRILTQVVWAEHHPVSIIVNHPLNVTNQTEMADFDGIVRRLETMEHSIGPVSTLLWLKDYRNYYKEVKATADSMFGFLDYDYEHEEHANQTTSLISSAASNNEPITLEFLPDFLDDIRYGYYNGDIRWSMVRGEPVVHRFLFTTVYRNTSEWMVKVQLMLKWRDIAEHSHLNVSVFEASSYFIDQIISLKSVTVTSVIVTFVCMAAVCAVFIPSPCSVLCASWAIAAISLGTFGFLSWWGMDLDPVIMSATLMTVGVSVDFTAHTSYHYQHTGKAHEDSQETPCKSKTDRVERTLSAVAWPMCMAGLSTVFCVVPLIALQSYGPEVFVKSILLVVAWGLAHGLWILPTFLAALPNCMTGAGCCQDDHTRHWQDPNSADNDEMVLSVTKDGHVEMVSLTNNGAADPDHVKLDEQMPCTSYRIDTTTEPL